MTTKIITWLWSQPNARFAYTVSHVNAWASAMRANCTRDVSFACVTDHPDGLLDWIEAIPLPQDFIDCKTDQWKESAGLPQCYRRLAMFAPDAKDWIGADRWISMDLDCIVVGNIDHLIDRTEDFLIFRGTSSSRPCNGGFVVMNNGARPQLYNDFSIENARIASSKFVGSDQAWIAYCLSGYADDWHSGWKETRVGEAEGIYHYSPRFVRTHGGKRFRPPHNLAILFCPGVEKFFADGTFHNAPDEMKQNVRLCMETKPRLLALKDSKGWAALAAKHSGAEIITDTSQAQTSDAVIVRMRCNGPEKAQTLEAVKFLQAQGCATLPTMQEALWYDDKVAQYEVLKQWMPQTWIFTSRADAAAGIDQMKFPIIRKLKQGAASCNVTLIKSKSALRKSIADAFRRNGDGYIYLQEYIKTDCDYRINISGRYVYGLTRYIRSEDQPFASGSGLKSVMNFTDPLERKAALLAVEIAREIGTQWVCFDFVWDGAEMKVLEMSSAWPVHRYDDRPLHYHDLQPTGKRGSEYFSEIKHILGVTNEPKQKTSIEVKTNTDGATYEQKRSLQIMLENVYQIPVVLVQDDDAELGHDCIVVADPHDTTKRVYRFSERHERLRAGIPADCSFIKFDSDIKPWSQELRGYHIKLSKHYREVMKRCR